MYVMCDVEMPELRQDASNRVPELQRKFFKDILGCLCKESMMGQEPVSIIHYTMLRSKRQYGHPKLRTTL